MCCQRLSPTAGDDGALCTPYTLGRALLALRASTRAVISCRECAPSAPLGLSARFGATDLERESRNSQKQPEWVHECGEECEEGDREERIGGDEAEQEGLKKSGGNSPEGRKIFLI